MIFNFNPVERKAEHASSSERGSQISLLKALIQAAGLLIITDQMTFFRGMRGTFQNQGILLKSNYRNFLKFAKRYYETTKICWYSNSSTHKRIEAHPELINIYLWEHSLYEAERDELNYAPCSFSALVIISLVIISIR